MKGYKVFNADFTCRDFQYEVGETYTMEEEPIPCERGFHFCEKLIDCFNYYRFHPDNRVAEVEAIGTVVNVGNKYVTNSIKIIREVSWEEVFALVNHGIGNNGYGNTGNNNHGNYNSGAKNNGNGNTGCFNKGAANVGSYNSGLGNSGLLNVGNLNTGNRNQGNRNTGDFNITSHCTGFFCTEKQTIRLFDKETNMTFDDWFETFASILLRDMPKDRGKVQKWWDTLNDIQKTAIKEIPNFDADKFELITGIKVE